MRLCECMAGEVMMHVRSGRPVRVAEPRKTSGSPSGVSVLYWHTDGRNFAAMRDGELKKATMREQRDFWRESFENLSEEA